MAQNCLQIGDFLLHWLQGGEFLLDAGTMFGVVPKVLWSKKLPCRQDNHLLLANDLLLIQTGAAKVVVDTGLGNKLTAKQRKIFAVTTDWRVEADLAALGVRRQEITHVVLTHCDFDHAGGVTMQGPEGLELTFPNAMHCIQRLEWEDVLKPNSRSKHTYWPINLDLLKDSPNLHLVQGREEIVPGIVLQLTGGHTRGHQMVRICSKGEQALHLADLLPNQAHFNPLWVTAFDNFPLDSVQQKEELIIEAVRQNSWFTFYHDPYLSACKYDEEGNIVQRFERAVSGS